MSILLYNTIKKGIQVQGGINTLGDLRGTFAAVERINSVISASEIDEALAFGLDKELDHSDLGLLNKDNYSEKISVLNSHYMSALRSATNGCSLAWSGDICLEGICFCIFQVKFSKGFPILCLS